MQTAQIVPFRQKELLLAKQDGIPFVPMKPIVEGMGLAWQVQHRKLQSGRFASTVTEMVIVAEDGKQREMTCLPLRKLSGWLMSIHPNKVRPELRDSIIAYQNECDDALWAYWNDGIAVRDVNTTNKMATLVDELIGMSELSVIKNLIRDKARAVPAAKAQSFALTMHNRLHTRFNVPRTELIPADQFEAACNFIAAYNVHEGEWLPKPEKRCGTVLNDLQLYDVYFVCHHFDTLYEIFKRHELYNFLKTHGSRAGVEMIDHFKDGCMAIWTLNRDLGGEFNAVQRRLGLDRYQPTIG
ncbi:phage antirepressor N-terminal domain-containing protein [Pseudomonas protegens]|uniref:phage antirepressor N-terminal domain-containing protein n=1 Tax=Pseudomonas protegens TaxID=380021 RepID=UPI003815590D